MTFGNRRKLSLLLFIVICSCSQPSDKNQLNLSGLADAKEPQLLANGVISTGEYETHAAFTTDNDTVYFLKCMPDLNTCAICVSYKTGNQWSLPEIVSFSGKYLDVDPFLTKDGQTMYFVSNRPYRKQDTLNGSWDIWKVQKKDSEWETPVHLDSVINSDADEYYPTMSDN